MNTLLNVITPSAQTDYSFDLLSLVLVAIVSVAFIVVWLTNRIIVRRVRNTEKRSRTLTDIMHHAFSLGNISMLRIQTNPFYVHNMHGSLIPADGLTYKQFLELLHPSDSIDFEMAVKRLSRREQESAEFFVRFKVTDTPLLKGAGEAGAGGVERWRRMTCQASIESGSSPLSIICTMTDTTDAYDEQAHSRELIDKYKRIFDQDIVGLAFYEKDGMLMAANSQLRQMYHYQGERDPLYFNTSLFDLTMYRDTVDRHHPEDLYFCTRDVVPERGVNIYLEVRMHPVFNSQGDLLYISEASRDVTQERALYLEVKKNNAEIRLANERIRDYEEELRYLMEGCDMRVWRTFYDKREVAFYKTLGTCEKRLSFAEYQTYFIDDDGTVSDQFNNPEKYFTKPMSLLCRMKPIFHEGRKEEWNILDFIPVFGADGKLEGSFGTIRNTTSLMMAQERLKEETRRANDSGRMKSVFMANMTHEIRTPLNSIVGFSDLLGMVESPDDRREMIHVILNNCDMLLRLINDILEVSSMDASTILVTPKPTDFAADFDKICLSLEKRIELPTVTFIKDNPCPSLPITIDSNRIEQVFTNFVTNAVKYTQAGHIRVGYMLTPTATPDTLPSLSTLHASLPTEPGLLLYCEDTGSGIPKDKQALVFDRFVKLNDYVQGTGLGLSICKAIANRLDGKTGVVSEGEGKGSTFWMWIPRNSNNEQ